MTHGTFVCVYDFTFLWYDLAAASPPTHNFILFHLDESAIPISQADLRITTVDLEGRKGIHRRHHSGSGPEVRMRNTRPHRPVDTSHRAVRHGGLVIESALRDGGPLAIPPFDRKADLDDRRAGKRFDFPPPQSNSVLSRSSGIPAPKLSIKRSTKSA